MRDFPSPVIDALSNRQVVRRMFTRCYMVEETFGFWDDVGTVTVADQDYVGTGKLLQIGNVSVGNDLTINGFTLKLNGIDAEALTDFYNYTWHLRAIHVDLGIFDPDTRNLVADLQPWFRGMMMQAPLKEKVKAAAELTVQCESAARFLTKINPSVRSDADQRHRASDDDFFKYVAIAGQNEIYWGKKIPSKKSSVQPPNEGLRRYSAWHH